jgi:hypothetical protein
MHIHGGGPATLGQSNQNGWINVSKVCFIVYMYIIVPRIMNLDYFFSNIIISIKTCIFCWPFGDLRMTNILIFILFSSTKLSGKCENL